MNGAFTGAVSASMLKSVGVRWALAGHSERRTIFGETDEYINGQCRKLIELGMSVMLCIGESESEYEADLAGAVCAVQLKKGLSGISKDEMANVAIAYEPVWAIGTGKQAHGHVCAMKTMLVKPGVLSCPYCVPHNPITGKVATPETAENVHKTVRGILADMYDEETADATRILYGGSVSPESVDELMAMPDIDGALVGGASLDATKFARIINFESA